MDNVFRKKYPNLDSQIYFKGNKWGKNYTDDQREELRESHLAFVASKNEIVNNISNYFGGFLHDSWVTKICHENNGLSIFLNDFSAHCFTDAICEKFKVNIPHKKRILPVELKFSQIKHISISWINNNSKILSLKKERFISKISEYLFDEIKILEKDRIELGMLFWSGLNGNKSTVLLQIECKNLEILESQRQAFEKLFQGEYLYLFDKYWEQREKGSVFCYSTSLQLLEEKT